MELVDNTAYSIEASELPPPYSVVKATLHHDVYLENKPNEKVEPNNEPKDRFYFVLFVVGLLGLVHILPYSFFLTANEYWMYKFRDPTSNTTDANDRTYLQANFVSLNQLYTTVPAVLSNFLLTFIAHKIKAITRIIFTLAFHTVIFSIQAIFVNVNTDSWQQQFFIITMISLILVMVSNAFGAAGQFGLFSKLPPIYIKAYLVGEGFAAMFNAVMRLISLIISPSPTGSAMIYFLTGSSLMLISTILTIIAARTEFFRYHNSSSKEDKKEKIRGTSEILKVTKSLRHMIILNAMFVFIPLASIYNLVVSEYDGDPNNVWAKTYFVNICTFLIPSIMNTLGRVIFSKVDWDCPVPLLYALVLGYEVFSALFIFLSNARPRHHLPVFIKHDWEYVMVMGSHFLLQGFMASTILMKTIRILPENRVEFGILIIMFFGSIGNAACSPLGVLAVKLL